jgi:4-amino-4-deoxy-L-arabinose transferase-like glycosyltransferase
MSVAPLLMVLFTSRSGQRAGGIVAEQLKLFGLSGLALVFGAICLFVLRAFCLKILGKYTPQAAEMVGPFAATMVFVGLLQALALWALASRWLKISLLYGALGLAYWLTLLTRGQSPGALLQTMPVAAGVAFGILLLAWLFAIRRPQSAAQS